MYAVHPTGYHPDEPKWQDYRRYSHYRLPGDVRSWLLDTGSLTQRLVAASGGHFRVNILKQSWQRPHLSEAQLLGIPQRQLAIIREVTLMCNNQPWVFARSVIPVTSLTGRLRHLRHFDNRPLGQMLFSDPSMQRRPFQLAVFDGNSQHIPRQLRQPLPLWGRRSRFELSEKPVMVSEIFLPTFKP